MGENALELLWPHREVLLSALERGLNRDDALDLLPAEVGIPPRGKRNTYLQALSNLRPVQELLHNELHKMRLEMEAAIKAQIEPAGQPEGQPAALVKNVNGWTLAFHGRYWRAHRRIGGKLRSVHVGKDISLAAAKIVAYETRLAALEPNPPDTGDGQTEPN